MVKDKLDTLLTILALEKVVTVKYHLKMYNLHYVNAENLLNKAGYRVRFLSHKDAKDPKCAPYVTIESKSVVTAFHSGRLSAVGLNLYLKTNFNDKFEHASMFSIDGGVGGTVEPGKLGEDFPLAVGDRAPGFQADMMVCENFVNSDVFNYTDYDYSREDINPWTMGVKVDKMPAEVDGMEVVFNIPKDTFYLVCEKQREATVAHLRKQGYFVLNHEDRCVFTNWQGARFNLPPNPVVLKNQKLVFEVSPLPSSGRTDWAEDGEGTSKGIGLSRFGSKTPVKDGKAPKGNESTTKKGLKTLDQLVVKMNERLERFKQFPCLRTYLNEFTPKNEVKDFMRVAMEERKVLTGSRGKSMIPVFKAHVKTVELTWGNLADLVFEVCGDEITSLYTLANLRAMVKETDGVPSFDGN